MLVGNMRLARSLASNAMAQRRLSLSVNVGLFLLSMCMRCDALECRSAITAEQNARVNAQTTMDELTTENSRGFSILGEKCWHGAKVSPKRIGNGMEGVASLYATNGTTSIISATGRWQAVMKKHCKSIASTIMVHTRLRTANGHRQQRTATIDARTTGSTRGEKLKHSRNGLAIPDASLRRQQCDIAFLVGCAQKKPCRFP